MDYQSGERGQNLQNKLGSEAGSLWEWLSWPRVSEACLFSLTVVWILRLVGGDLSSCKYWLGLRASMCGPG